MHMSQRNSAIDRSRMQARRARRRPSLVAVGGVTLLVGALGTTADALPLPGQDTRASAVTRIAGTTGPTGAMSAASSVVTNRVAGTDRIGTAIAVSRHVFPDKADIVYIARADNPVDALAAGTFTDGPTLLVPRTGAPDAVKQEIARLAPRTVVALGGTQAIPDAVLDALAGTPETVRLAGDDRFQTAALISRRTFPGTAKRVYLANSAAYADAATAGVLTDGPILLVPASGPIPAATLDEITRLAPETVTALGGTSAVPDATLEAAARGRATDRIAGADRVETAAAIGRRQFSGTAKTVYLVGAQAYADAIVSGTVTDGPILLVPTGGELPAAVADAIRTLKPTTITAIGGAAGISDDLLTQALALVPDVPTPTETPAPTAAPAPSTGGTTTTPTAGLPTALDWGSGTPISAVGKVSLGRTNVQLQGAGSGQLVTIEPRPLAPPQVAPALQVGMLGMGVAMARPTEITTPGGVPAGSSVVLTRTYSAPLPADVQPTFAYFDSATGQWTPVDSILSADRTELTARVTHLSPWTDVVTGVTSANAAAVMAAGGTSGDSAAAFRFIGDPYTPGAAAPRCSADLPSWITRDRISHILDGVANPARFCVGRDPQSPNDLQVKVVANRNYGLVVHTAVTPAAETNTSDASVTLDPATEAEATTALDSSIGSAASAWAAPNPQLVMGGREVTLRFTEAQVRSVAVNRPLVVASPVNGAGYVGSQVMQRLVTLGVGKAKVADLAANGILDCGTSLQNVNVDDSVAVAKALLACPALKPANLTPQLADALRATDPTLSAGAATDQAAGIVGNVTTALTWATTPTPTSRTHQADLARPASAYLVTTAP